MGKIEARIDAQGVHVHADGHDIGIARSFAIAKQSSFNAVGAGRMAISASATPVPRSLWGWTDNTTLSRYLRCCEM